MMTSDARKREAERTTQPPVVDVAEGRRLLAVVQQTHWSKAKDSDFATFDAYKRWVNANIEALLDTAEAVEQLRVEGPTAWTEVDPLHVVAPGERVRCEVNDRDDNAMELTASEEMGGWRVQGLFRGAGEYAKYYTARALLGEAS